MLSVRVYRYAVWGNLNWELARSRCYTGVPLFEKISSTAAIATAIFQTQGQGLKSLLCVRILCVRRGVCGNSFVRSGMCEKGHVKNVLYEKCYV